MKVVDVLCAVLVVIGGLNWGMIGMLGFNLVEFLSGNIFLERTVYTLIGFSSLHQAFNWRRIQGRWKVSQEEPQELLCDDPTL